MLRIGLRTAMKPIQELDGLRHDQLSGPLSTKLCRPVQT